MPFLLIYVTDKSAIEATRRLYKRHSELFISKLDNKLYLLKNSGEALAYATKLMLRYKGFVDLFAVEQLNLRDIPEKIRRVAEWMETQPEIGLKKAIKHTEIQDLKELRKIKLQYYKSSSEKSSKHSKSRDLTGLIYTSQEKEKNTSTS